VEKDIRQLEEDIDLRNAQIADLQQKILDSDQGKVFQFLSNASDTSVCKYSLINSKQSKSGKLHFCLLHGTDNSGLYFHRNKSVFVIDVLFVVCIPLCFTTENIEMLLVVIIIMMLSVTENKVKTRWDTVQSMAEAKCALKHLFELAAEMKTHVTNKDAKCEDLLVSFK
jgi:hypothetical protein